MTDFEQLVIQKLDKIIELLKKEIEEPPIKNRTLRIVPPSGSITGGICNCHLHKPGELPGGWYCPVHGQCF